MGWMQKLCEAYDVGIAGDQSKEAIRLVPLGFVNKKVKYHVVLSRDGQFVSADELFDKAQSQEIPSTPQAESRTSKDGAPFPLTEKLKYLVYEEQNLKRFRQYMEQLEAWCEQPDAPVCLRAVYRYLDGHTLLADLEAQPNLNLKYYKDTETRQELGKDAEAMVCFSVQMGDENPDDLWLRTDVKESWSHFLAEKLPGAKEFCYVEGKTLPCVEKHPKVQGNAKLISAKDTEYPFQYRGRFMDDRSAAMVSYSATVRAHNALAWLIERQGMQKYGMIWVGWNTNGAVMNPPLDGINGFIEEEEDEDDADSKPVIDTFASYAKEVNSAARGYGGRLHDYNPERTNSAVILGLEAATDGRVSVTYYQECPGNEYVKRLEDWYKDCCWWRYSKKKKGKEIASPNPNDIAAAVLGNTAVEIAKKGEKPPTKLMRNVQSRLLSCIVDRQPLPQEFIQSAFHRVCMPLSFTSGRGQWSRSVWENSLETACAMIACFQKRGQRKGCEVFAPELDANSQQADYLYGRLLAVTDYIEEKAAGKGRDYPTNAVRLMPQFVYQPFETWPRIYKKLLPSFQKLGSDGEQYQRMLEEIEQLFSDEDRYERGALSLEFLQGYSSQRQRFFQKWEPAVEREYEIPKRRSELYGCLLAIADAVERKACSEERAGLTNAMQMVPAFEARPYESWGRLHDKLLPYLERISKPEQAIFYQKLIGMVETWFTQPQREETAPLDGGYLHGFYCMRRMLRQNLAVSLKPETWEAAEDMRGALFGQMLGTAERLERRYLIEKETERRFTNEWRFMTAFAQKPAEIWNFLKVKLKPYQKYAGKRGEKENGILERLEAELKENGWFTNAPLGSIYLHFYYEERNKLYLK